MSQINPSLHILILDFWTISYSQGAEGRAAALQNPQKYQFFPKTHLSTCFLQGSNVFSAFPLLAREEKKKNPLLGGENKKNF